MDAADIQLAVAGISTIGIIAVALYNGWINSQRSREERTTPSYTDLLEQVRDSNDKIKDMQSSVDQLEEDRSTMRETIRELRDEVAAERKAREEIREDTADFIDAIGRYALGQATKPVLPQHLAGHVDRGLWDEVPEDQRRFRLPGE